MIVCLCGCVFVILLALPPSSVVGVGRVCFGVVVVVVFVVVVVLGCCCCC